MSHRDLTGTPLRVGDYFAYAAAAGRSAVLKLGRVTELRENGSLKALTVDFWPGQEAFWWDMRLNIYDPEAGGRWELQYNGRGVTLSQLHRLLVIPAERVPAAARVLLEGRNA